MTRRGKRDDVDFRAARRRVELLIDVRAEVRHRAFSIWVGLFDLADATGSEFVIELSDRAISQGLGVSRQAWYEYRGVLEAAGLLAAGPYRGPRPQILRLIPPRFE